MTQPNAQKGAGYARRVGPVAAVVIGAILGAFSIYQLWPLISRWIDPPKAVQDVPAPQAAVPAQTTAPEMSDARLGTDSSLSAVPLQLVLVATAPGRNSREGTATLGPDPRNPQTYAAGALLENGARIEEIYSDHVVLKLGDKRAKLYLTPAAALQASEAASKAPLFTKDSLKPAQEAKERNLELTRVGGSLAKVVSKPSSVDTLSETVRAQPEYENGRLAGFRVFPGRKKNGFAQLGLQPGDVISFIDGKRIEKDSQWQEISQALGDGAVINVTVLREGQLTHLSLDGLVLIPQPSA